MKSAANRRKRKKGPAIPKAKKKRTTSAMKFSPKEASMLSVIAQNRGIPKSQMLQLLRKFQLSARVLSVAHELVELNENEHYTAKPSKRFKVAKGYFGWATKSASVAKS